LPDFWTHVLAGEEMIAAGGSDHLYRTVEENMEAFIMGCQGPDLFFYNISTPWRGPVLGKRMHYNGLRTAFEHVVKYGKAHRSGGCLSAFLCGYLSHFLVDRYMHPFVLARSRNFTVHKKLENELDSFLLKHHLGISPRAVNPYLMMEFEEGMPEAILGFFQEHLDEIYDFNRGRSTTLSSYRDFKYLQNVLYSPGPVKRTLLRFSGAFIPYNLDSLLYEAGSELLWDEEKQRFLQQYEKVVDLGADTLEEVELFWQDRLHYSDLSDHLKELDFAPPDRQEIISTLPLGEQLSG